MDEQEVLARLKAHVARRQSFSPDEQRPAPPRSEVSRLDLSNISRHAAELWAARDWVGQLNPRNPGLLNQLAQAFKKAIQRSLSWYTRSLQAFHYKVAEAIEEQGSTINSMERNLARLEEELRGIRGEVGAIPATIERSQKASEDRLQESLRAAELATQEQQSPYVEFFHGVSPVLDIGCGRGEFLELLQENGIAAQGIDSDRAACDAVRRKRLNVIESDLFEHLRQLPDRSVGGAFSARVIEYLPVYLQSELISLLGSKIKPGGMVVIETMNPESRLGFGRNSRLDPTHLHLIHPELLKSLLESNRFSDVTLCSLAPVEGLLTPTNGSGNLPEPTDAHRRPVSGATTRLSSIQAYAAVARRS